MSRSTVLLSLVAFAMLGGGIGAVLFVLRERAGEEAPATILILGIQSHQGAFRKDDRDRDGVHDYWIQDIAGMFLAGNSWPAVEAADATPGRSGPAPVPFRGFLVAAVRRGGSDRNHDAACVYPANPRSLGRYTSLLDDSGAIYKRDLDGKPVLQRPPADELARDRRR